VGIRDTDNYAKWKAIVKAAMKFDAGRWSAEVETLHKARKSRFLRKPSATALLEASAVDTGARSRMVELRMRARALSREVGMANEALTNFMWNKKLLPGPTNEARSRQAKAVTRRGQEVRAALDAFVENVDDAVEDIDKAAWAMKLMMEAIEVISRKETVL